MTRSVDPLFRPFTLGPASAPRLQLANRIVMAPMTRQRSPGGIPGPDVATYYRRRAEQETGLIITEGTVVDDPVSSMNSAIPNFFGPALEGWRRVVDEVHAVGGRIMPQLWHTGMARNPKGDVPSPELPSIGPSGLARPGKLVGEPMSTARIAQVVDAFARAAGAARALDFDGLELHGAHGYLIDQFFWAGTNERTDAYGGSLEKRTRFAVEIVEAARREVGPDFPIVLRFSQWKQQDYAARLAQTPEELAAFLTPLCEAGVDIFHCSQRRFWEPEFEGSTLNLAGWTRKLTGRPTITVGSVALSGEFIAAFGGESSTVTGIDELIDRNARDEFDLVAVGRALIVDPAWAHKVHTGRFDDLLPFSPAALAEYP
jgi:2,4-dienoyl-CoA reductase-like NADH-dependent reductase (Old Yellow Enzyme family)